MGCDSFVPVFDPGFDTFGSVRARSCMLFDIICTVGCRITTGPSSQVYQLLNKDSKSRVCEVLVGSVAASLEAVQALLIVASYSEKGWMLTSIATRMAMQLDLPGAYEDAVRFAAGMGSSVSRSWDSGTGATNQDILAPCFERLERGSVYSSSNTSSPSTAENRLALKLKQICDAAEFSCHTPRDSCPKSNSTLFAPSHTPKSHFQT